MLREGVNWVEFRGSTKVARPDTGVQVVSGRGVRNVNVA